MKLLKSAALLSLAFVFSASAHATSEKECTIYHSTSPELKEEINKRGWNFKNSKALCKKLTDNNAMLFILNTQHITDNESVAAVFLALADKKLVDQGILLTNDVHAIAINRSPVRSEQVERDLLYASTMWSIEQLNEENFNELNKVRQKFKQFDPKKPLPVNAFGGNKECLTHLRTNNTKMSTFHKENGFNVNYGFKETAFQNNCAELKKNKVLIFNNGFHSTNEIGTFVAATRLHQFYDYQNQGIPVFSTDTQIELFYAPNNPQEDNDFVADKTLYQAFNTIVSYPLTPQQIKSITKTRQALAKLH